jgi:predicted TIM-barrel fold metal-dependent hydrolase
LCLSKYPEWSFHRQGLASFEEHMEMQEAMLAQNPDTTFIVAHVGSYAENLKQVSGWLDTYPNMYIDVAARIDQLGRQPYTARAFIERHQDRILFGSDYEPTLTPADFYPIHYRFFETNDEYFDHPFAGFLGIWKIYGIGLNDAVLEKIYFKNAQRVLGL